MRRRANRYSIVRSLAYRLRGASSSKEGSGRTLNISRSGLLFETTSSPEVGSRIELSVQLGEVLGGPNVKLQAKGITVRSDHGETAVALKKRQLRRSLGPLQQEAPPTDSPASDPPDSSDDS